MKYRGLAADRDASIYVPWQQRPMGMSYLVVRSSGDPAALVPTLRRLIARLDPTLPLPQVRTLEDHVADSIAGRRLQLVPTVAVAVLALAVSMVGLFGALGRAVTERRHELSIRAAVGASPGRRARRGPRASLPVWARPATGRGLDDGVVELFAALVPLRHVQGGVAGQAGGVRVHRPRSSGRGRPRRPFPESDCHLPPMTCRVATKPGVFSRTAGARPWPPSAVRPPAAATCRRRRPRGDA